MRIRTLDQLQPQEVEELVARNRGTFQEVLPQVREIVARVRAEGDRALHHFTRAYDGVALPSLEVSPEEVQRAYDAVGTDLLQALKQAAANVERYHTLQAPPERLEFLAPGVRAGWVVRP
ncbi:MAG: histidinol dehydrogenase, partial [Anaerolineae bacterium]|nr:histidinol dehydrogenase [Anaerolineae bacterium]